MGLMFVCAFTGNVNKSGYLFSYSLNVIHFRDMDTWEGVDYDLNIRSLGRLSLVSYAE